MFRSKRKKKNKNKNKNKKIKNKKIKNKKIKYKKINNMSKNKRNGTFVYSCIYLLKTYSPVNATGSPQGFYEEEEEEQGNRNFRFKGGHGSAKWTKDINMNEVGIWVHSKDNNLEKRKKCVVMSF